MADAPVEYSTHKVSSARGADGRPLNTFDKVSQYMRSKPEYQVLYDADYEQKINNGLLQIISNGIDNIVRDLKNELGNDFTESNKKAGEIKQMLDDLKRNIDVEILKVGDEGGNKSNAITLETTANGKIKEKINNEFYINDVNSNIIDIPVGYDFKNLDTQQQNVIGDQQRLLVSEDPATDEEIINRLKNCQNLEFLYLKKHEEIMKIFAFTINLFDKYKYAIKIILFLLKNLVYKDSNDDNPPPPNPDPRGINLPITIIKDIKKLVNDQKTVQGVIDRMNAAIIDSNDNVTNIDPDIENEINRRIPNNPGV
jgi:hypothetical protein